MIPLFNFLDGVVNLFLWVLLVLLISYILVGSILFLGVPLLLMPLRCIIVFLSYILGGPLLFLGVLLYVLLLLFLGLLLCVFLLLFLGVMLCVVLLFLCFLPRFHVFCGSGTSSLGIVFMTKSRHGE